MRLTEQMIDRLGREDLIAAVRNAENCVVTLENQQAAYQEVTKRLKDIKERKESIEKGCWWWPIVIGVFGFTFTITFLGDGNALLAVLLLAATCALIYGSRQKYKRQKKDRMKAARKYYSENYPAVQEDEQRIKQEVQDFICSDEYNNAVLLIPPDYFDQYSIREIGRILENRRARTLSEAINTYESDLHRQRLEAAAERTAEAQERTANASEEQASHTRVMAENSARIARNTKSTARAAKLNAFINYMK